MSSKSITCLITLAILAWMPQAMAEEVGSLKGIVKDASGSPMRGVMVTAFDDTIAMNVSVLTAPDGRFTIPGLKPRTYTARARLIGKDDEFIAGVKVEAGKSNAEDLKFTMKPATDLNSQRRGENLFSLLKFDNEKDKMNFKMFCSYCHQVGTIGFRTPEEPVDWDTMITRMDGFGGLFEHTQETLVKRLLEAYSPEAEANWPTYVPPPVPDGKALLATVTEWDIGKEDACMIHDMELGLDGNVYAVDLTNDSIIILNTATGATKVVGIPGGKDPATDAIPRKGPHSIERDLEGNMWMTLCLSGEMAKLDVKTLEWTVVSGAPAPRPRGAYPHTLRIDKKGIVWFSDAGAGIFSLDPKTNEVTGYKLPTKDQAVGAGKGESRGITPYGIDIAPDGKVWYTKLNGNRVGRIDPSVEGGDVKEWNPPFRGPRRLHVAPNGIVWVPAFGTGNFASFDPQTEEWELFDLPDAINRIPYALNVHPKTGDVWICGTSSDELIRFIPSTKELVFYPMPSRVTYTREIEFDEEGNVWTCNSNAPARHIERHRGSIIKLAYKD